MKNKLFNTIKTMNRTSKVLLLVVLLLSSLLLLSWCRNGTVSDDSHDHNTISEQSTTWTCSMHPQIKLPKAGKCPICFMDLIPLVTDDGGDDAYKTITLTQNAIEMARINTAEVTYQDVKRQFSLNGKVVVDETTVGQISSRFKGRIEKLFINFTGVPVRRGEKAFRIYSPELYGAQDAYVNTYSVYQKSLQSEDHTYLESDKLSLDAARDRLSLLGMTNGQINYLTKTLIPSETITVYSEYSGIVIQKKIPEGTYVNTGTSIYSIADLSRVWIILDAYETDIQWLKLGQKVDMAVEAYPGQNFSGTIAYIDPILNEMTRTLRIRINMDNRDGRLKPGMLATGILHSTITSNDNLLAEKLVIPVTAPLITGKRAIVYIETVNADGEYIYEAREVVLGPKTEAFYTIESGLTEGERVVIEGNFKIDAAMQILAKSSMMNRELFDPEESGPSQENSQTQSNEPADVWTFSSEPLSEEETKQVTKLFLKLADLHNSLADDNFKKSSERLSDIQTYIDKKMAGQFDDPDIDYILHAVFTLPKPASIGDLRKDLVPVNNFIREFTQQRSFVSTKDLYLNHCPMANNSNGAFWIDIKKGIRNPYFGESMLNCGSTKQILKGE